MNVSQHHFFLRTLVLYGIFLAPFAVRAVSFSFGPNEVNILEGFLMPLIDVIITLGAPVVVFFIIWNGFKIVLAQGNNVELTKAKDSLVGALVGGTILLSAKVILEVMFEVVRDLVA